MLSRPELPRELRESFKRLTILTVVSLYILETILHSVIIQQLRHQDIPQDQHTTRHTSNFAQPTHHLSLFKKKPSYKGTLHYNHNMFEQLKNEELTFLRVG